VKTKSTRRITETNCLRFIFAARASLCYALLCFVSTRHLIAQDRPTEEQVKAAYLFNFGRFIRHAGTSQQASTFDLCVIGQDPISKILEQTTTNQQIGDRVVQIRRYENPSDARGCVIVFMGQSEAGRLDKDVAALKGSDALTVSDIPQFLARGGMLEFVIQNSRVRFSVNLDAVNHTNLQLGSELLRVAASVSGEPRREVPQ
jgi:YfiR/HmsC-like